MSEKTTGRKSLNPEWLYDSRDSVAPASSTYVQPIQPESLESMTNRESQRQAALQQELKDKQGYFTPSDPLHTSTLKPAPVKTKEQYARENRDKENMATAHEVLDEHVAPAMLDAVDAASFAYPALKGLGVLGKAARTARNISLARDMSRAMNAASPALSTASTAPLHVPYTFGESTLGRASGRGLFNFQTAQKVHDFTPHASGDFWYGLRGPFQSYESVAGKPNGFLSANPKTDVTTGNVGALGNKEVIRTQPRGAIAEMSERLYNPQMVVRPTRDNATVTSLNKGELPGYIASGERYGNASTFSPNYLGAPTTSLSEFASSLNEPNVDLFRGKEFVNEFRQNLALHGYQNTAKGLGGASGLTDEQIAQLIAHRYNALTNSQTGAVKGTVFRHGTTSNFDTFDWKNNLGASTSNAGLMGPGNYFSLDSYQYNGGIKWDPIANATKRNSGVNMPILLNGISDVQDARAAQELGLTMGDPRLVRRYPAQIGFGRPKALNDKLDFSTDYSTLYNDKGHVDYFSGHNPSADAIRNERAKYDNLITWPNIERHSNQNVLYTGFNDAHTGQEFKLTRDTGIKSLFSLPESLYRDPATGKLVMKADWNNPSLFKSVTGAALGAGAYSNQGNGDSNVKKRGGRIDINKLKFL